MKLDSTRHDEESDVETDADFFGGCVLTGFSSPLTDWVINNPPEKEEL